MSVQATMLQPLIGRRFLCAKALPSALRTCASSSPQIPVVDLSPFVHSGRASSKEERVQAARALSAGFAETGFAVVVGHGVSKSVMDALRQSAMRFFSMSLHEKQEVNNGCGVGYAESPYCYMEENGAQLLGDFNRPHDMVESLTYFGIRKPDVQQRLPETPHELKPSILDFDVQFGQFRRNLQTACELALDLDEGFLTQRCDDGNENIRLAHYPDPLVPPLEGQMRYGAHVDSYGITVLRLDAENPRGLQAQIDGQWIDIPFIENSFVLNVGACLSRWTNGLWKASIHRVLNYPGRRLSIVCAAVKPTDNVLIEPIGPAATGPAKFTPILMRDFAAERVALHRTSYLEENIVANADLSALGEDIRNYHW